MKRLNTITRSSILAIVLAAGAIGSIGCTSVRENRLDAQTGQVTSVDRKQFFVKSIFKRGPRNVVVNGNPEMANAQMNGQMNGQMSPQYAPQGAPQMAPQMAPQYAPQYAPQTAPQYAPQNAQYAPQNGAPIAPNANGNMGGTQASPFGRIGG